MHVLWSYVISGLGSADSIRKFTLTPFAYVLEIVKMAAEIEVSQTQTPASGLAQPPVVRKNGKNWHESRKAFRPTAGQTSYAKRAARQAQETEVKKLEKEMKDEKEAERQVSLRLHLARASIGTLLTCEKRRIQAIKDKRAAKEEKERYEKMAEKMHRKRVERLKRREKRNKMLKS